METRREASVQRTVTSGDVCRKQPHDVGPQSRQCRIYLQEGEGKREGKSVRGPAGAPQSLHRQISLHFSLKASISSVCAPSNVINLLYPLSFLALSPFCLLPFTPSQDFTGGIPFYFQSPISATSDQVIEQIELFYAARFR